MPLRLVSIVKWGSEYDLYIKDWAAKWKIILGFDDVIKLLNYTEVVEADIICLPEQWHPKNVESFEEEFKDIINVAKEHDTTIIAGAFL